jgi:hypothetical protein
MSMISTDTAEATFAGAKTPRDVDAALHEMTNLGGAPRYIAIDDWIPVDISGHGHTLRILVAPDYYAIGGFRVGRETPFGAQDVADAFNAILPSRKLERDIQNASSPRIPFLDVKAPPWNIPLSHIETHAAVVAANDAADQKFGALGISPGDGLTIGYRKAIVVGPALDGTKVAIFGGIGTNLDPTTGRRDIVQSYYTGHPSSYSDYSHGIVLVSRKAWLDGEPVDLRVDVFGSTDPAVLSLVNDHVDGAGHIERFDPVFPNAGSQSRAEFGGGGPAAPAGGTVSSSPSSPSSSKGGGGGFVATSPPTSSLSTGAGVVAFALGVTAIAWWIWG